MIKKVLFGIRGSEKYSEDIIKILEEFGGKNTENKTAKREDLIYYIRKLGFENEWRIWDSDEPFSGFIYGYEDFIKLIKYHVGDFVKRPGLPALYKIMRLKWENFKVFYKIEDDWFSEDELIPTNEDLSPNFEKDSEKFLYHEGEWVTVTENGTQVKEGNISEFLIDEVVKDLITGEIKYQVNGKLYPPRQISRVHVHAQEESHIEEKIGINAKAFMLHGQDYSGKRIAYKIPEGYELDKIEDGEIIFKEQLPKFPETYEESCEILGISPINLYTGLNTGIALSYIQRMDILNQLYICRDAFWKLSNSWIPSDEVEGFPILQITDSVIFKFPTSWHVNKFQENFKHLINKLNFWK